MPTGPGGGFVSVSVPVRRHEARLRVRVASGVSVSGLAAALSHTACPSAPLPCWSCALLAPSLPTALLASTQLGVSDPTGTWPRLLLALEGSPDPPAPTGCCLSHCPS